MCRSTLLVSSLQQGILKYSIDLLSVIIIELSEISWWNVSRVITWYSLTWDTYFDHIRMFWLQMREIRCAGCMEIGDLFSVIGATPAPKWKLKYQKIQIPSRYSGHYTDRVSSSSSSSGINDISILQSTWDCTELLTAMLCSSNEMTRISNLVWVCSMLCYVLQIHATPPNQSFENQSFWE